MSYVPWFNLIVRIQNRDTHIIFFFFFSFFFAFWRICFDFCFTFFGRGRNIVSIICIFVCFVFQLYLFPFFLFLTLWFLLRLFYYSYIKL